MNIKRYSGRPKDRHSIRSMNMQYDRLFKKYEKAFDYIEELEATVKKQAAAYQEYTKNLVRKDERIEELEATVKKQAQELAQNRNEALKQAELWWRY